MIKKAIVTLFLALSLALPVLAQGSLCVVEYTTGERQEWKNEQQDPQKILTEFLNSGKDGKLTVTDDGELNFAIQKVGEQLTITAPDAPTEKLTVKEMLEDLKAGPAPAPPKEGY